MSQNSFHAAAATLVRGGYAIIPLQYGEKRPSGEGWTETVTTLDSLATWPERGNIGILAAHTPGVDLDIRDEAFVGDMIEWIAEHFGETAMRVGLAPKTLLVFRADTPFRKAASRFWTDANGVEHRVEVLGKGQQFVAYGLHPDTHKPYRWTTDATPRNTPVDDLPLLDAEGAQAIVDEFERRAAAAGWTPKGSASRTTNEDDDLEFLRPKPDIDDDELRQVVELFDNPGRDYDLWVRVGAALHHQTEGSQLGLDLWHEWSSRSPLYDAASVESKWKSFGKYKGRKITVAFMLAATREARARLAAERKVGEARDIRTEARAAIQAAPDGDTLLDTVLPMLAVAKIDSATESVLLGELAARHKAISGIKPSKSALDRRLQELRRRQEDQQIRAISLERDVAQAVLGEHFGGGAHLKVFSKLWWHYRDGVWTRTEDDAVRGKVQETLIGMGESGDERLTRLAETVVESRGDRLSALVSSIFATLTGMLAENGLDDPLCLSANRVSMVINCQNAELWFNDAGDMKVARHNASHLLTSQIGCAYDAKAECPTWDAAVRKVFKSCIDPEAVIRHFEEVMGYILQPTRHEAIFVMLKGPGGNGKSFLMAVVSALMGPGAVAGASISEIASGASSHFTDSLQGKLMLLDDDLAAGTLLPDDWIKKLSEAKLITANPKFGRAYNFTARSVPVILTNTWPATKDRSGGMRRRAMIFESRHVLTADEKDPRHYQRILDRELPGVLNRFIEGFRRFLRRGSKFDVPVECDLSAKEWLAISNPTAMFVARVIEKTGNRRDYVTGKMMYDAYFNWARHWEHGIKVLGRYKLYEALVELGVQRVNHSNQTVFSGVKIRLVEGLESIFQDENSDDAL